MIGHLTAVTTSALLVAFPLQAQQFSLRLGGLRTHYADSLDAGGGSAAAQMSWAGNRSQGVMEASWSRFNTGSAGQLWGSYAAIGPRNRHAGLGLRLEGVTNGIVNSVWSATGSTELFGALVSGGWTVALGVNAGGVRSIDTARFGTAGAALRSWYERGHWTIGAAVAATTSTSYRYTDFTASADFHQGRVVWGAIAATRQGDLGGPPWYQGRVAVRISPAMSLEASAGGYPRDLAGYAHGSFANLGLRIRLSPPPPAAVLVPSTGIATTRVLVEPLGHARTRVTIALPDASAPAIVGSWNDWSPTPLIRAADGRWSAVLPIGAGTYRFAIVLDGGRWIVPEGVTRLPDDFDGEVGILVVQR